jgi:hypothetical protein
MMRFHLFFLDLLNLVIGVWEFDGMRCGSEIS